jgi:hypothetical protein
MESFLITSGIVLSFGTFCTACVLIGDRQEKQEAAKLAA